MRFSDVITEHDLQTKVRKLRDLLIHNYRVKVRVSFKSRKNFDYSVGKETIDNIYSRVSDISIRDVKLSFKTEGSDIISLFLPLKKENKIHEKKEIQNQQEKTIKTKNTNNNNENIKLTIKSNETIKNPIQKTKNETNLNISSDKEKIKDKINKTKQEDILNSKLKKTINKSKKNASKEEEEENA